MDNDYVVWLRRGVFDVAHISVDFGSVLSFVYQVLDITLNVIQLQKPQDIYLKILCGYSTCGCDEGLGKGG